MSFIDLMIRGIAEYRAPAWSQSPRRKYQVPDTQKVQSSSKAEIKSVKR
jgi:hypothetical protein|tara:strand:+ start:8239 stop:8385 length:147 start_codon:yes stop_codon:yes gene_type:complete